MRGNKEYDFQQHIIEKLTAAGYEYRKNTYDQTFAVDRDCLKRFLESTQKDGLKKLQKRHPDVMETVIRAANDEMLKRGKNYVLKHGICIDGIGIKLMYAKPASNMNEKMVENYKRNIFSVMEEVWVSQTERMDLVLFLNGIAIVTMELKYTPSGQNYRFAINQYKNARNKNTKIFDVMTGAVVNFAMDENEVYMSTYINGKDTVFLPFNQGTGTGINAEAGNPACKNEFPVHYMYDYIMLPDTVLNLIANYIYVDNNSLLIFPRFHQIDCVEKLIEAVKKNRTKKDYLIQHSAGSGKTNEISWLAYRLASLHVYDGARAVAVFDKIIIMTDRRTVDRQLQQAIMGREHCEGFVKALGRGCTSADLKEALASNAKIIITTIQKFPYIADEIGYMKSKSFGVIIDEAHSSTSGEDLKAVKKALNLGVDVEDMEDAVTENMKQTGRQANVAMFAFTATPKPKTLETFGVQTPDGKFAAFHTYSMKQACSEGYILDVFQAYIEYQTYYRVRKVVNSDPVCNKRDTKRDITKMVSLDDTNIDQRLNIIIDNFMSRVKCQLDGHGKAMILCASREEAVKMKRKLDKKLKKRGIDVKALVAFSGSVVIDGEEYTEAKMNGFPESKTAAKFDTDEYGILVVADKYQTGFDQPKLCGMYIMKSLNGVNAVQTLSRLNRPCRPYVKKPVIIDFKNTCSDMIDAFAPFYTTTTLAEPASLDDLLKINSELTASGVLIAEEVDKASRMILKNEKTSSDRVYISSAFAGLTKRIEAAGSSAGIIKNRIKNFLKIYVGVSMNTEMKDVELHKRYVFLNAYKSVMGAEEREFNDNHADEMLVIDDVNQVGGKETTREILANGNDVNGTGSGTGGETVEQDDFLSNIIEELNNKIGLKLDSKALIPYIKNIKEQLIADEQLKNAAKQNEECDFATVYYNKIELIFVEELKNLYGIGDSSEVEGLSKKEKEDRIEFARAMMDIKMRKRIFGMYLDEVHHRMKGEEQ